MASPLTAARLVEALREEGCTVREVGDWRTNNRNHVGTWGPVNGVMIHHTVTGPRTDVVSLIYHGHSELPGPLSAGCITKDGTVHLVGNGRANHAGGGDPDVLRAVVSESYGDYPPRTNEHQGSSGAVDGNARFYGFECENLGDGKDPWPPAQYVAMVRAAAGICRAHGWGPKSAIGHLEWSDWKSDPRGIDMKTFRRDLAACLALPAGAWSDTQEEHVALSTDDIRKMWLTDGFVKNPNPATAAENPYIAPATGLRNIETVVRRTEAKVAALTEANSKLVDTVAQLAAGLGNLDPATVVAELRAAIESIDVHITTDHPEA